MTRFVLLTFVFLAFAFYELSGGTDFDSEQLRLSRVEAPDETDATNIQDPVIARAAQAQDVTRVALNLSSVSDVQSTATPRTDAVSVVPDAKPILSEEPPAVLLPSLIVDRAEVSPVDLGRTDEAFSDPQPEETVAAAPSIFDVRSISGSSVNVRGGPGTGFAVVNRLQRGDLVEILQNPGAGWVQLRPLDGGTVGWMAEFLLSDG
jgi:hypothetical protein